ncbi:hypothetical protein [Gemmatimonas aurantiaca]|uniref:hypothetical protein n=1 Tax=Gemmatimonas aurantiaca TaxID=173480 RepID=UPI00301D737D
MLSLDDYLIDVVVKSVELSNLSGSKHLFHNEFTKAAVTTLENRQALTFSLYVAEGTTLFAWALEGNGDEPMARAVFPFKHTGNIDADAVAFWQCVQSIQTTFTKLGHGKPLKSEDDYRPSEAYIYTLARYIETEQEMPNNWTPSYMGVKPVTFYMAWDFEKDRLWLRVESDDHDRSLPDDTRLTFTPYFRSDSGDDLTDDVWLSWTLYAPSLGGDNEGLIESGLIPFYTSGDLERDSLAYVNSFATFLRLKSLFHKAP